MDLNQTENTKRLFKPVKEQREYDFLFNKNIRGSLVAGKPVFGKKNYFL